MSSSGGSAAIREAIETRRRKIKIPEPSREQLNKVAERKMAWWKETISIAFLDKDGEPIKGCTWKVARQHLTPVWLQTVCLKCPMHAKINYLKEQTIGDIVWPADAQMKCRPSPWSYVVIAVEERNITDWSRDPGYYGDVQVIIFDVPLKTDNDKFKARPGIQDIRAWLMFGLQEGDEEAKKTQEIISKLEKDAKKVDHSISRIGYMEFIDKTSFVKGEKQNLTDDEEAAKRKEQHDILVAQRDRMDVDLKEAHAVLKRIEEQMKKTAVDFKLASVQPNCGTCTYYVSFPGDQGSRLEDVLCAKTDWPGINLAANHDGKPPWAGRGEIPDGSKSSIPRYTEHVVNMRAARICRLPHGFGQHKVARARKVKYGSRVSLPSSPDTSTSFTPLKPTIVQSAVSTTVSTPALESLSNANSARKGPKKEALRGADSEEWESTDAASVFLRDGGKGEAKGNLADVPFAGKRFCFYQGEFKEGQRSGFGIETTVAGIYMGENRGNRKNGAGVLHCANGDHIEGNFVSETRQGRGTCNRFPEAGNSPNRYKEGVPSGLVEIRFASGATYKGEMNQGRITGKGDFVSCLGERKSGDFVDGELHGEGSVVNVLGQTWDGQWRDGEMEGKGRHSAPEAGEFVGDWFRGVLQGKGRIVFKGGNTYEGFFRDHSRSGPGTLFVGNTKSVYDPRSGKTTLRSNRVYEGNWRASELRSGSMVTFTRTNITSCLGLNEKGKYNRAVDRIERRELQQVQRRTVQSADFYRRYEKIFRQQVDKRMLHLYSKQARLANQARITKQLDLIEDHFHKLNADGLRVAYQARDMKVEKLMRLTGKQLEAETGSVEQATEKLERIAAARGTIPNTTLLSRLVQSRFEEAQELQQLMDTSKAAATAEGIACAQQAEMNYSL
ncbi:unnamed protein product [Ascophyllum nodosum]